MKINSEYLKKYIAIDVNTSQLRELLASIGVETDETVQYKGVDVLEVEITPNRPDWLSHYGISREISAKRPELTLTPLRLHPVPEIKNPEIIPVSIANPQECGRFSCCIVRNIIVRESIPEIRELLLSLGQRPINNIVDISNLVLRLNGHPNHIYDLDTLIGPEIQVRRAREGEPLTLLDGRELTLTGESLVIADKEKALGLGGIMGGLGTGVTETTRNILIECAWFDPIQVRKSSRRLDIRSDASYLFERGADIMDTQDTIRLILQFLADDQNGALNIASFQDLFPLPFKPIHIILDKKYPAAYSGIPVDENLSRQILTNLGFKLTDNTHAWDVEIPSYRIDIYGKQDLVEEITRIYGYDKLESVLPNSFNPVLRPDRRRELLKDLRQRLTALGFYEAMNYTFHSPKENEAFAIPGLNRRFLELKNPIGLDFSVMRNSLLPGLLRNTALNFNQSVNRAALFEFGNVFNVEANGGSIVEEEYMALSASGVCHEANWQSPASHPFDIYLFKSLLDSVIRSLFLEISFVEKPFPFFRQGASLALFINSREAGCLGELSPDLLSRQKIEIPVFAAEIKLAHILEQLHDNRFQPWNKFPATSRDFSFLINHDVSYNQLENAVRELKPDALESWKLNDVYQGKNIPAGKISFSMSFSYRSEEKTLINEEVNDLHNGFTARLIQRLDLVQR